MEFLQSLVPLFQIGAQVVGAASVVAAVVPKANQAVPALKALRGLLDYLALNVGNAKNAK